MGRRLGTPISGNLVNCTGYPAGTAALKNTGTSGNTVPLLDAANTWTLTQTSSQGWDAALGTGYALGGVQTLYRSATYTFITDPSGNITLFFGNNTDPANYTDNSTHYWRDKNSTYRVQLTGASGLYPTTDNSLPLGGASNRWTVVYATTGAINTSDAADKVFGQKEIDVEAMYRAVLAVPMSLFQWQDAVDAKGKDKARYHYGPTAQAVRDAFLSEGIDPTRLAMFCVDEEYENEFFDIEENVEGDDGKIKRVKVNKGVRSVATGKNRLALRLDQFYAARAEAIYRLLLKR